MEKPRILLVEDEPILALEMKEDLEDRGFAVLDPIADGDMVLHAFLKNKPDVVLMDIKLHGFRDGVDSAAQIRAFYQTPIVFVSTYTQDSVKDRLAKIRTYSYMQKPYEVSALERLIRAAMATTA